MEERKPNFTIILRKRRSSTCSVDALARQVVTGSHSLLEPPRSESDFVISGGNRRSRIKVYADLSVDSAENVLRRFKDRSYGVRSRGLGRVEDNSYEARIVKAA